MSQYFITNRPRFNNNPRRQHVVKLPFFVGSYSMMFVLTLFIGLLSIIYLVVFNNNATNGYQIQRLEYERNELITQREQKTLSLSHSQTLEYLKQDPKAQQMVKQQPEYFFVNRSIAAN